MMMLNTPAGNPIEAARTADLPGAGLAVSYKRFSSKQQEGGDSIRRQADQAAVWAGAYGFEILDLQLSDEGKSAFKGANFSEGGALFEFVQMLEDGRLSAGVTLIAENPDRISRQHHRKGVEIIEKVIAAGANVALLSGVFLPAYRPLDAMDTIRLTLEFDRANQESAYKSYRIGQAWNQNTADVNDGSRLRSGVTPSWLEIEGEVKGEKLFVFNVIKEKADVVREIFSRFANGESPSGIARDLDRRGVPPLRRGRWKGANVSQLLRSEAPFGTLEIGRMISDDERSGKRKIEGKEYRKADRIITQLIPEYFPRIIDSETESRARFLLQNREAAYKSKEAITAPTIKTKAMLTGVLRDADGTKAKRKSYPRTAAYVNSVTNRYIGAVPHIDGVLIDYWPDLRKAAMIQTDSDTEGLEMALDSAKDTLEFVKARPGVAPRLVLAAEAEVEELETELKLRRQSNGLGVIELPRRIDDLEPHEVNSLVRQVVREVRAIKSEMVRYEVQEVQRESGAFERRVQVPVFDLSVTLKNGIELNLGSGAGGLKPYKKDE